MQTAGKGLPYYIVTMAATSVTEFILIPIRQDVDIEEVGTPENRALTDLVSSLKASEGSTRVFSGRQIENPGTYVVVVSKFHSMLSPPILLLPPSRC
jgi:hypothetical protein